MPRGGPCRWAASGRARPAAPRGWSLGPLEVGDDLLAPAGAGHDLDQLPAVITPGVEDLLRRMHQQRHGRVLPLRHGGDHTARMPTPRAQTDGWPDRRRVALVTGAG